MNDHVNQCEKVLAALKAGPVTNRQLGRICQRFGARIHELRKAGHPIQTTKVSAKRTIYTYGR